MSNQSRGIQVQAPPHSCTRPNGTTQHTALQETASKHRCCYALYRWRSIEQDDEYEVTQVVEYGRSYVLNSQIAEGVKNANDTKYQ